MPQIKNLGMPTAGPVPAMPPSPAGLPQTRPGPTAVTQAEPEPDDLTRIFNSYTNGQIDRNSLIEQLRSISTGRGGILALLETMEGKSNPEAAGDFAPVPAAAPPVGALPGSPPALVAPEAQPELDARHQRISQMLQSYGLQPLDADQMSTELNPQHTAAARWDYPTAPTPADKKKTAAQSGLTMTGAPAPVKAPVLPSTAQTLTADMAAAPAATPVATPPVATTPTALPTTTPQPVPAARPRGYDYTPESPADMQKRIRLESESREHVINGLVYNLINGEYVLTGARAPQGARHKVTGMASPLPTEEGPPTEQGPFKINTRTGEVIGPAGNPLKQVNWETGAFTREDGTQGVSSHLIALGQDWKDLIEEKAGQQQDSTGAVIQRGSSLGQIAGDIYGQVVRGDIRNWFGKQLTGGLLGDAGVDFEDGFVKTALGFVGILNPEEQKEVAPEGFDPTQEVDNMIYMALEGQYPDINSFVTEYKAKKVADLVRLADSLGMPLGKARDEWMKQQESAGIRKWHEEAKEHWGEYKAGAAGTTDYTAAELKTLTTDELLTKFIDMNEDNPTALAGIADQILAAAAAKGQLDDDGNWKLALQDDSQAHELLKRRSFTAMESLQAAFERGNYREAIRQFDIVQALEDAKLQLASRRLTFDIDQAREQQALDEAALTGWLKKQTWVQEENGFGRFVTEEVQTIAGLKLALLAQQVQVDIAGVTGVYRYQEKDTRSHLPDGTKNPTFGELIWKETDTLAKAQQALNRLEVQGEIQILDDDGKVVSTVTSLGQKRLNQELDLANRELTFKERVAFGTGADESPLTERNPVLSGLLTGLEGLRQSGSSMGVGQQLSHFGTNSVKLIQDYLIQKGATEADLQVPAGIDTKTNQYRTNPDGTLEMRTGSIEEAAHYLQGKLNSLAKQGTPITEAQLTRLLPVEPKPDPMSPEGLAESGATIADRISAAEIEADLEKEKNRLAEEARQFNDSMELQREMMVLEKMQLDTAMQRLYADQRRVEIEDKLARSTILSEAEQLNVSKQLADIQQQIADTNKEQMLAEFSGMLNDEPTLAGQEFALSKMLAKASATGEITFDGVTQDTLELSRFMWEKDMENKKLTLEYERLDQENQIAQQTATLAENRYALDAAIQVGELQNAVAIRKNTMLIEQQKQLLERDKLRTDTLLALSSPGLMVFVQRYGLLDELGAALGIDFTDEASGGVPTAASMWDTTAYPFPSAQQLKGMSASERQIVLAESAAASDMSLEAGMGAIAGGIPGYKDVPTLTRPTMLTGEAR